MTIAKQGDVWCNHDHKRELDTRAARNNGAVWTVEARLELYNGFGGGLDVVALAELTGRTYDSITTKLRAAGLLTSVSYNAHVLTTRGANLINGHRKTVVSGSSIIFQLTNQQGQDNMNPQVPKCKHDDIAMPPGADTPVIETVVMIGNIRADNISDDSIFSRIADLEQQIAHLDRIQNKPKKLGAKIEAMHADIKKLVEYVDSRA